MKRLEGNLCVLTGTGQGIGRATAERFAAECEASTPTAAANRKCRSLSNELNFDDRLGRRHSHHFTKGRRKCACATVAVLPRYT